ncbi:hypothetical protein DFQ26_007941 [Actinomortierella ambigua]|nr:hypothetical protein DFQ26_007941 [Actinomortierella ambigua]
MRLFRPKTKDEHRSLEVNIYTDYTGPFGLPAVYSTPEAPATIRGYVEFDCFEDFTAGDLDLHFRVKSEAKWDRHYGEAHVVYHSKEVLQEENFHYDLPHVKPGVVAAGRSKHEFEVQLQPLLPSSVKGSRGWLSYRFTATLHRPFPRRDIVFKQDIWCFNTIQNAASPDRIPEQLMSTGVWENCLPYSCCLPSEKVALGSLVPMTIRFDPFLQESGHFGQQLVVVSAVVKLKQYTYLWHKRDTYNEKKEALTLDVDDEWPSGSHGWERTIMVPITPAPRLSATTYTKPMRKTHKLKLIMKIRTNSQSDKEAKEFRVEMDVTMTAPRPPHELPNEQLPKYSELDDADD